MSKSYFFYDLETSGFSPRRDRIMQFAGIRVDEKLDPIPGEEYNYLIYLAEDILPSPTAIMTTHITPQKTRESGYSEADFARIFADKIAVPDTTFVGYNNIRFDDEHMRNFLWRNFRDPYEWEWRNGCSRWDLLDVVRLVRALRPEGISWPMMKIASDNGEIREISITMTGMQDTSFGTLAVAQMILDRVNYTGANPQMQPAPLEGIDADVAKHPGYLDGVNKMGRAAISTT